jgi:hypothetical protein
MELPNPIEKRNILAARDVLVQTLIDYGNAFFEAEALDDAFNFLEKAGDVEGVRRVKQRAIDEGNTAVMLCDILRSKLVEITREDWLAAAQNAIKAGKPTYAAQAYRKLGDIEKLNELLTQIPGQKPIEPPEAEKEEEQ